MTGYSDEDVETAARALAGDHWQHAIDDARAVLDAVAPRIAERAWAEGYEAATAPRALPRNPYAPDGATT